MFYLNDGILGGSSKDVISDLNGPGTLVLFLITASQNAFAKTPPQEINSLPNSLLSAIPYPRKPPS